jgi:hypothetical protein
MVHYLLVKMISQMVLTLPVKKTTLITLDMLELTCPKWQGGVTKREGPTITDDAYTVCRRPRRLVFYWSIPHQTPITPQTQTVFSVPSLICCDQTQQHNTRHNMHLTQMHQRKCFHLIHKLCTCSESTGMSFNTKQQVLPPSLVL